MNFVFGISNLERAFVQDFCIKRHEEAIKKATLAMTTNA